jgi:hypothetical protein
LHSDVEGEVVAQSADHIALLVHKTFNVTIPSTEIPSRYQWKEEAWYDTKKDVAVVALSARVLTATISLDDMQTICTLRKDN